MWDTEDSLGKGNPRTGLMDITRGGMVGLAATVLAPKGQKYFTVAAQ